MNAKPVTVEQVINEDTYTILLTVHDGDTTTQVTLTPAEALVVDIGLWTALQEPERCRFDESFSVVTVDGDHLCHDHAKSRDDSVEANAS